MKTIIFQLAAMLLVSGAWAQNVEFKAANFKDDKEGFKAAMESIKQGDALREQAYLGMLEVKDMSYTWLSALSHYAKAQQLNDNSTMLNYKIGSCLLYTNHKSQAFTHLDKAKTLGGSLEKDFNFYYAQALHLQGKFAEATAALKKFETEGSTKQLEELSKFIKKYKSEAKSATALIAQEERVWVDNLETINSEKDEYGPCVSTDGETLIFTSTRDNGHPTNDLGFYDSDIYSSTFDGKSWSKVKNLGAPVNGTSDDVSSSLSYDGQKMLMFSKSSDNFDVLETQLKGAKWSMPTSKAKAINGPDNQTFSSYSFDDVKIYYITDEKGGGAKAGTDIFFSGRLAMGNGYYGKGQTAGNKINTKFHEGSVYMTPDGKYMYFSSQGHNSMGGYDIFVSKWHQGQWLEPENLGYPINTPYDDLFFAGTANGKFAYIASNREGGKGGMDLYKVTFWGPEKPMVLDTEDYLLASMAVPIQEVGLEKAVSVNKRSLTVFKGSVVDAITQKPLEADIEITDNGSGDVMNTVVTNSATGKFLLSLPAGKNYGISVNKTNYLFHSENFNLPEGGDFNMVNKKVELYNIEVGSKIALRNVFFATGQAEIKSNSHAELDRLVKLLKDVPGLKIELSGHTDNVGSESANVKLSQNRAQAVVDYLKGKGIADSRLTAKGYGSSAPIANNKTADGRQQNRRTEFLITAN